MDVDTTIFITAVVGLVTTNLGAFYFMANRLGASIDGMGARIDGVGARINALDTRIDALDTRLNARIDRLDGRIDLLQGAVVDIGARLTVLEQRG